MSDQASLQKIVDEFIAFDKQLDCGLCGKPLAGDIHWGFTFVDDKPTKICGWCVEDARAAAWRAEKEAAK